MSSIKHIDQRVAVLIDAHNLYHTAQNLYGRNVKFENILEEAIQGRQLIRAIAYVSTSESGEEAPFFEALTKAGIEVKSKEVQVFPDGKKKADWDVGITVDAIKLSQKVDTIILLSGDGDFVPMVRYVQETAGVQVEVAAFQKTSSAKLIEAVDDFMDLSSNTKKFLLPRRRGASSARPRSSTKATATPKKPTAPKKKPSPKPAPTSPKDPQKNDDQPKRRRRGSRGGRGKKNNA